MILFGDLHGCFDTFMLLLEEVRMDFPDRQVCLVGDLIDRGPKSAQIIQYVIDNGFLSVRGNHEQMMIDEADLNGPIINPTTGIWMVNGGHETLKSYHKGRYLGTLDSNTEEYTHPRLGLNLDMYKWGTHYDFISKLPYYLEFKDLKDENGRHLLVSHSSAHTIFRTTPPNRMKETNPRFGAELMWNRIRPIKPINNPKVFNVFGHSPKTKPQIEEHYANIDTGACFTNYRNEGYGTMTAFVFPEKKVYQLDTID